MNERIDTLRAQLREDPSSRLFFQLGELLRKQGELEESVDVLRKGLDSYPRYVAAWVSLGRALYQVSSFAEAEEAFAKALELDRENPIAARMLGETAMGREDWVQAIKALKLARIFSPRDDELEERINFVEQMLQESGELEGLPTAAAPPQSAEPIAREEQPAGVSEEDAEPEPLPEPDLSEEDAEPEPLPEPDLPEPEEDLPPPLPEVQGFAEPQAVPEAPAEINDPFESEEEPPPSEVFALDGDDPFADASPRDDSGVFMLGGDVFGDLSQSAPPIAVEEMPAAEPESFEEQEALAAPEPDAFDEPESFEEPEAPDDAVFEAPAPDQPVPLSEPLAHSSVLDDGVGESADKVGADTIPGQTLTEAVTEELPLPDLDQDEETDSPDIVTDPLPLPTVTLARLALEQGDRGLAESTLLNLLDADPGNREAGELLNELRAPAASEDLEAVAGDSLKQAKINALQGWLHGVKSAATEHRQ